MEESETTLNSGQNSAHVTARILFREKAVKAALTPKEMMTILTEKLLKAIRGVQMFGVVSIPTTRAPFPLFLPLLLCSVSLLSFVPVSAPELPLGTSVGPLCASQGCRCPWRLVCRSRGSECLQAAFCSRPGCLSDVLILP